jgi:hypothetical protein
MSLLTSTAPRRRGSAQALSAALALLPAGGCDGSQAPAAPFPSPTSTALSSVAAPAPEPSSPGSAPAPLASATSAPSGSGSGTAAPSASASSAPSRWLGGWDSPPCGERKYVRRITLAGDGAFVAEERVSPCPERVPCYWSGIIDWSGTWRPEGDQTVRLRATKAPSQKMSSPPALPDRLEWSQALGAFEEVLPTGRCPYGRKP